MSAIINGSIRVDRLPKEKFIKGRDGAVYYNFTIAVQDETRYGNNVAFMDSQTKEEREETLERRRKAWANGEPPGHGSHYLEGERNNWIWPIEDLTDIRETKYWKYVQKLQEVSKVVYKNK